MLLDKIKIRELLETLDEKLAETEVHRVKIIVVGGALLALHDLRDSTYDVDVFARTGRNGLFAASESVAVEKDLPLDWLNCDVENLEYDVDYFKLNKLFSLKVLDIYGVSNLTLLAMKFSAAFERGIGKDESDICKLWKTAGVTLKEVEKHFYKVCPSRYFDYELAQAIIDSGDLYDSDNFSSIFN